MIKSESAIDKVKIVFAYGSFEHIGVNDIL